MQQKADAMQLYKEAAMISMVCASLPQITREIAGPYVIRPPPPLGVFAHGTWLRLWLRLRRQSWVPFTPRQGVCVRLQLQPRL